MDSPVLHLHPDDDVAVAVGPIAAGTNVDVLERPIVIRDAIANGHKFAVRHIAAGDVIRKFGFPIGVARSAIDEGTHVHSHNLAYSDGANEGHQATIPAPDGPIDGLPDTFDGFVRSDGRVGTRNFIGIITTVNCSATVARLIAEHFRGPAAMADTPNVDGVVALTHASGCGLAPGGDGHELLRRTLLGYAQHPNFAAVAVIGLGCETNQVDELIASMDPATASRVHPLVIQDAGGTRASLAHGIEMVTSLVRQANSHQRQPAPVSELVLGLECGGSDGYSGLTANPALGFAADQLIARGGTAILGETPEIVGAEHLLIARATSRQVAADLEATIAWWRDYVATHGASLDNNPSPGNKAGGLTTIAEKSLGAVMKGGHSPLTAVCDYAAQVPRGGLVFMDTPGYDPVSVTGMVAGGATIVGFTTGRGSVFGCKPVPSVKIASNDDVFRRMIDDMDVNAGPIATGESTLADVGSRLYEQLIAIASGQPTKSEELGLGDHEFAPWLLGAVL